MTQFYFRDKIISIPRAEEGASLLHWLRANGHIGTKEGCASGDCGACTVVMIEFEQDQLHYRSINSCITLLAQLHGCFLVTIEDLAKDGQLHPVQHAMVMSHGSQCGFCTPGFVMSLFALYHRNTASPLTRHQINIALGGNLCRCTGYSSIIEAAFQSCANPEVDQFKLNEKDIIEKLKSIAAKADLTESLIALKEKSARPICGGTDIGLEVTQYQQELNVVALNHIEELRKISTDDNNINIGAAAAYSAVQEAVESDYPQFAKLIERIGSTQIRNQGSLGGNIANASPIGDTPPVLMVLDAELELTSADAKRRVAINKFFSGYRTTVLEKGEIIKNITIPRAKENSHLTVTKLSKRFEDDISTVLFAMYYERDDERLKNVRIAFGGMAATPIRVPHVEALLEDVIATKENINKAIDALALLPISDVRASKEYRFAMAKQLLIDALYEKAHDVQSFSPIEVTL